MCFLVFNRLADRVFLLRLLKFGDLCLGFVIKIPYKSKGYPRADNKNTGKKHREKLDAEDGGVAYDLYVLVVSEPGEMR